MEYDSAVKEEWHKAIFRNMDALGGHEMWTTSDCERQILYGITACEM